MREWSAEAEFGERKRNPEASNGSERGTGGRDGSAHAVLAADRWNVDGRKHGYVFRSNLHNDEAHRCPDIDRIFYNLENPAISRKKISSIPESVDFFSGRYYMNFDIQ